MLALSARPAVLLPAANAAAFTQQQRSIAHLQRKRTRAQPTRSYRAADDPVVSTEWLAQHLEEVTVLDVRGRVDTVLVEPGVEQSTYLPGYDEYLEGHIPGAVFWDWTKDAIDASAAAPVQLLQEPDLLAAALEAKGVSHERPVVAYDGGDGMMAARLWWILTTAGHPSAFVLDGGWGKWRAEGRPSELYEPCTLKVYAYFEAAQQLQLRATLEDLQQLPQLQHPQQQQQQQPQQQSSQQQGQRQEVLLLDTRNEQQFKGQVRRGPRGGHVPGAVNLPRGALLDDTTGLFKPLQDQQALLQQAGVRLPGPQGQQQAADAAAAGGDPQQRVILYCNGGVAACTAALALHRLGHRNWAVYDGSWNEYGASDLPVSLPAL